MLKKGVRLSPLTEFKKGHIPANKMSVGSVTVRTQKNDGTRAWIKIAEPNKWVLRAVHVWLQSGQTIPKGYVVHHKDHNKLNDDISNLALITRAEHANHHRKELDRARAGMVLSIKKITCLKCGSETESKKKDSFCHECRQQSRRESNRRYKQRLRAAA
jgi:predicted Zn-ribbon and HTH transcriptional regulator